MASTCTTIVLMRLVAGLSLGGCGISVFNPFGVTGTITMKIINSTRRTSIIGVTLISDIARLYHHHRPFP